MARVCAEAAHDDGRGFPMILSGEELERLDRELNNLRAALDTLVAREPERALQLCTDLYRFWGTRHVREGRDWLERALRAGGADVSPTVRAGALFAAAWLAEYQGDAGARRRMADECLAAARSAGDPLILARALYVSGLALMYDDITASEANYRESLAICEALGDDIGVATSSNDRRAGADRRRPGRGAGPRRAGAGAVAGDGRCDRSRTRGLQHGSDGAGNGRPPTCRGSAARVADGERRGGRSPPASRHAGGSRHPGSAARPGIAAATLYGAAEAELKAVGVVLDSTDGEPFARAYALLRDALGEQRALEAQARGRELYRDQADRLVAGVLAADAPAAPAGDVLSAREREVVRFLAAGMTNAEIASGSCSASTRCIAMWPTSWSSSARARAPPRRSPRPNAACSSGPGPDGPSHRHRHAWPVRPMRARSALPEDRRTVLTNAEEAHEWPTRS